MLCQLGGLGTPRFGFVLKALSGAVSPQPSPPEGGPRLNSRPLQSPRLLLRIIGYILGLYRDYRVYVGVI